MIRISLGYNWPVYGRKWGIRIFSPFRKYGLHLHFGKYAVSIGPEAGCNPALHRWGIFTRHAMDEPFADKLTWF